MRTSRRKFFLTVSAVCASSAALSGCHAPLFRGQSPDQPDIVDQSIADDDGVQLVRDYALPTGTHYVKLKAVGLVTGLDGTGCDPPNSPSRERLLAEMKSHDANRPETMLASDATALVEIRAFLPPGVKKGDHFDIEMRLPRRSKSTSLKGGWLMPARLREAVMLGGSVRTGDVDGLAVGRVYSEALFNKNDEEAGVKVARVLGGATAMKSRPLGLRVLTAHRTIKTSTIVAAAINSRFHYYNGRRKQGVADPKDDSYIELALPPRYKNNIKRFMDVASRVAVDESSSLRARRLVDLERRLLEPTTASEAALQLEAIGSDAVSTLMAGLNSVDSEVRFYSAEALGYLGVPESAPILAQFAASERAFRWHALTSLSTMDHVAAYDALADLLDEPSAETRYGAFRAMQTRNPRDPLIQGKVLAESFAFHTIASSGEPIVHFSRTRRPEVILFGKNAEMEPPRFLFAGKKILLKARKDGQVKVTRFALGNEKNQSIVVSPRLDELVRAIVEMGGGYAEVFEALSKAKDDGYLRARLVVDARPRLGLKYDRSDNESQDEPSRFHVASPIPELYSNRLDAAESKKAADEGAYVEDDAGPTVWSRMKGWFGGD